MSNFYDSAKVWVQAGNGGDGIVAFLREKYRPDGGPAGGDGGKGGSIIFKVDTGLRTLMDFHFRMRFKADSGENGMPKGKYGKSAKDLIIKVPSGTIVKDADTGELLGDMTEDGEEVVVAKGGRGGRGNIKFATHNNPAPEVAENGEPGEERFLSLELRVLADVGLVGFPSVGKSTLLSAVSGANPKISAYHFTTLNPNLGVVEVKNHDTFVMADLPGLIEGAAEGVGLGFAFLRHIERTKVILHVIDMGSFENRDPFDDYIKINKELQEYDPSILRRPTIIVANKMDIPEGELYLEEFQEKLKEYFDTHFPDLALPEIVPISAYQHQGLSELMEKTYHLVQLAEEQELKEKESLEKENPQSEEKVYEFEEEEPYFYLSRDEDGGWRLSGREIERDFKMANLEYNESALRFARKLKFKGVDDALRESGAKEGDIIRILDYEFEFFE